MLTEIAEDTRNPWSRDRPNGTRCIPRSSVLVLKENPSLLCSALNCSALSIIDLSLPLSPLLCPAHSLPALAAGYFWMGFKSFQAHFSSCYFAKLFPSAKYDYYCTRGRGLSVCACNHIFLILVALTFTLTHAHMHTHTHTHILYTR